MHKGVNRLRIIGGEWRSRLVEFPDVEGLRPTPDRVRETLFNWLGQNLTGKRCLDLYAGAGGLGFEALSRNALEVVMVERSRPAVEALRENAERLRPADRLQLVQGDALEFLRGPARVFDVIFVDPPYASDALQEALRVLPPWMAPDAVVYAESGRALSLDAGWNVRKAGKAGAVKFHLLDRSSND